MEVKRFKFANYDEAMNKLLPLLRGRVFHTTTAAAYAGILSDGFIGSNKDGKYPDAYPQSKNSFFRKRGCVSMVDLRTATDKQIELGDMQYRFLSPSSSREALLLFLKSSCHDSLILEGPGEGDYSTFVEHIEAGFPDSIPISCIEEAWEITFEKPDRTLIDELDDIIAGRKPASNRPLNASSVRKSSARTAMCEFDVSDETMQMPEWAGAQQRADLNRRRKLPACRR